MLTLKPILTRDPAPYSHPYYKRQSTIDSAFSSEFDSSLESATTREIFPCKENIEEEEAERLAKVRSMVPEDPPHPSLSNLIPPTEEVLIYVQNTVGKEVSAECACCVGKEVSADCACCVGKEVSADCACCVICNLTFAIW